MLPSVRHAFRVLRNDPGFTAVAICSLALGIGATAAMFSFGDAMLLRPLPVLDADRVVTINTAKSAPFGLNSLISYPDYADLRDHNRTFDGMVAASYSYFGFSPNANVLPHMKWGLYVSGNFFRVMGVIPDVGRSFRPEEDLVESRDPVVMLGHDFWVAQFGADRSIPGSHIRLNGIEFTVIGVAPARFTGIDNVMRPQLYVPVAMAPRMSRKNYLRDRDLGWLCVKGRLKQGVGIRRAQADIGALSAGLQRLHSESSPDQRLVVETELQFRVAQGPGQMAMTEMLGLLGLCVLLVACANVAGLLLSRSRARSREIAVRLAIGAGRGTIIRQLLLENLLVAAAGGLGGVAIADAMGEFWRRFPIPSDVPVVFDAGVNPRVLLFTLVVALLSTLLFGLAPALRATRPDLVPALKAADADSGGGRRLWGRHTIVAAQVALSLVLLAISVSLVQGFRDQLLPGPGYRTDHLFLTGMDTQLTHYSEDQSAKFYKDLLSGARAAAGVRSAAISATVPMQDAAPSIGVVPEGWQLAPGQPATATLSAAVSEGYFETIGIPILQGRGFLETDREGAPLVAVVNEQMAQHYWKGRAVGQRFHLGTSNDPLVQVVGIAKKSKYLWIAEPVIDFVYLPFRQHPVSKATLLSESRTADAGKLGGVVREVVRKLDPDMPVFDQRTMQDLYAQRAVKTSNIVVGLVGGMGAMGMALATVGLYGLVAYSVSRRTREIGIRMALGADPGSVAWMVVRKGLLLSLAGIIAGNAAAWYLCPLITSNLSLFAFNRTDPLIFVAISVVLLATTALAAWGPARRAAGIDPLTSLHDE